MKTLLLLVVAVLLVAVLFGCAAPRYMTEEQDRKFRETCEKDGCAVIPLPLLDEILRRLGVMLDV